MAPVSVVLAAGKSTRMKSALPKVLHEVCGRPMIECVLDAARHAGISRHVIVVGYEACKVKEALAGQADVEFALQTEQKGTGHAVMMCRDNLRGHDGPVLVLTGDAPLMRPESLRSLLDEFRAQNAACVIGTAETEFNQGLGRIVRSEMGEFLKIVEQKDATPAELAIREINVGCYVFDCRLLFEALAEIKPDNRQKEYYLTDCAAILTAKGKRVVASKKLDVIEALGVNTRAELAKVHRALQQRCLDRLMAEGVTIVDPAQVSIDLRARIGIDTIIFPFTTITGPAIIGANCRIGPHAAIGPRAVLVDGTVVGPFASVG
ncbi:MAG: bifunctional N-acetylglucosamine-1-phosphate uridyltransferase/glucosamine-1-phosphate acetyltransferase [Deltaproteobacteria bacterium]